MSARICNCSKVRSRDIRSAIPQALEKGKEITAGVIMELLWKEFSCDECIWRFDDTIEQELGYLVQKSKEDNL